MSFNLNDQQVLEVIKHLHKSMEAQQQDRILDPDHLDDFKRREIKPLYPHKYITEYNVRKPVKFGCREICCQLSSGSTFCACCRDITAPDGVYQEFGLGANIYFNFMKHFTCCFILYAVLSVISVGLCYFVSMSNNVNPSSNYQEFFFSTTMGSFSALNFNCKYSQRNSSISANYSYNFDLKCPAGSIYEYGPVLTTNSEATISSCKLEREKYETKANDFYIDLSTYSLSKDASCNSSSCKVTATFSVQPTTEVLSYSYACTNPSYKFFNTVEIQVRVLTYIVVGIDLLITLGFLFFLCSEKSGQDNQIDYFKKFQLSLKDFSLKLKGFTANSFDEEFEELMSTIKKREQDFDQRIIQIKTPDDQEYIDMNEKRKQRYFQLFKFMERNFFDPLINPFQYKNAQQFIENVFNSLGDYLSFKRQLHQLLDEYRNSKETQLRKDKEMSVYFVLESSNDVSTFKKLRTKFCCDRYIVTPRGKSYSFEEAPNPDMLQWPNKTKWTFCRVIISWLFTLVIVAGSYVLFGFIQWQQTRLLSAYNFKIDCGLFYPVKSDITTFSSTLYSLNNVQYTHCYCSTNYLSFNINDQVSGHCSVWWRSYLLYLAIPILISLGLVMYNIFVSVIFKKITEWEGHFYVTDQMFSYVVKRSFILIMNMGLIIVLLNINYRGDLNISELNFLFKGSYKDITSDWYISIGSIVIMTMIFNILSPFMELFMTSLFKCFRKCVDKRCWTRKTSQKYKSDFINLYSGDVYPMQQRYALIISIFWITLLFNSVIPLLNIIAALSFLLLQLIDKLLVFKFFKTPLNFDQSLHQKFMKTLYVSIILHMVSSAFLLSQPNLIPEKSTFSGFSSIKANNQRLNSLIQTYYIIPYVAIFLILVGYGLLKSTVIGLLSGCNQGIQRQSSYKLRNLQSFFQSLSEYQLFRLKIMTQKEINRLQIQSRRRSQYNLRTDHSDKFINPMKSKPESMEEMDLQLKIFKKTHRSITDQLQQYKQNKVQRKARLIGLPAYQQSFSEVQSQKQKQMLSLDQVLEQIALKQK